MMKLKAPKALKRGDTIAVIRPAGRLDQKSYLDSIRAIRESGFCVALYPKKFKQDSFFSGSDEDRAQELDWAFREPGISAVLCCRGGYGSVRTVMHLNAKNLSGWRPKIFIGYSDITYLHQWLQNEKGFKTIHGPLTGRLPSREVKNFLNDIMHLPYKATSEVWSEIRNQGSSKKVSGLLVGGNLSLIQVAGPACLPKVPMILALEDVNEDFYRLDRMLMALKDSGYSKFIRGIILGSLLNCGKNDAKIFGRERLIETLRSLTDGPIWERARFGHGVRRQRLLPLGCRVELNKNQFRILDPVVVE